MHVVPDARPPGVSTQTESTTSGPKTSKISAHESTWAVSFHPAVLKLVFHRNQWCLCQTLRSCPSLGGREGRLGRPKHAIWFVCVFLSMSVVATPSCRTPVRLSGSSDRSTSEAKIDRTRRDWSWHSFRRYGCRKLLSRVDGRCQRLNHAGLTQSVDRRQRSDQIRW